MCIGDRGAAGAYAAAHRGAGTPYGPVTMRVSGGSPPYSWSITNNALPDGLTLDPALGIISGTPGTAQLFPFDITVTDSSANSATVSLTINVNPGITIDTISLPDGTTGVAYSQDLTAEGGSPPYSWAVTAGSLPPGLALNQQAGNAAGGTPGNIGGIPVLAGLYSFTVTAMDSLGAKASQALSINVHLGALYIVTTALPPGTLGKVYQAQFVAAGGTGNYTWTLVSGSLPPGLTLNPDGSVTGILRGAGHYAFEVEVTES
jgi:hypothetical protein